jgi:aarF domain-containing kinase
VTRWLFPENLALIRGLRKRHSAELDFRTEAANLAEVRANLQRRGFEPALVRVPAVPDERLVTKCVLAMELLRGESLARAIDAEMGEVAAALGLRGAAELRTRLMRRVQQHFEAGGGAHSDRWFEVAERAAPLVRAYAKAAAAARRWWRWLVGSAVFSVAARVGLTSSKSLAATDDERERTRPDVGRAVRTLVRVHGVAMLLDGVYNADPHPGNVLLLPDGRLGLIDYGMVGRLSEGDRQCIARVVLGLAAGDVAAVVDEYRRAGYRACWHSGRPHADAVVHRFATFHLDRINLAPVQATTDGPPMPVMDVFRSTIEHAVPDWVEQARRLGGLLIGVGSQAGRPISLSHEWAPIAAEVLQCSPGTGQAAANARLRTHLTGLNL